MAKSIDQQEVRRLVDDGAQLIEVLPEQEYQEQHIAGAVNIPLKKLTRESVGRFDVDKALIVYCYDYL